MQDRLWNRTKAKDAPRGWWRWNIKNPYNYAKGMIKQVREIERRKLSPSRLRVAIVEDSHQGISVADCRAILRKINYRF